MSRIKSKILILVEGKLTEAVHIFRALIRWLSLGQMGKKQSREIKADVHIQLLDKRDKCIGVHMHACVQVW